MTDPRSENYEQRTATWCHSMVWNCTLRRADPAVR